MPRFRPYRDDDWDAFLALDLETGRASILDEGEAAFAERWPTLLKERFGWTTTGPTTNASSLLVLESDDGDYAGHLWLSDQIDLFSGEVKLWITTIAVHASFRRRGFGRMLMERAIEEARRRGHRRIGLGVDARNATARALYEQMGFATVRLGLELKL